jgi:hypothetical protein
MPITGYSLLLSPSGQTINSATSPVTIPGPSQLNFLRHPAGFRPLTLFGCLLDAGLANGVQVKVASCFPLSLAVSSAHFLVVCNFCSFLSKVSVRAVNSVGMGPSLDSNWAIPCEQAQTSVAFAVVTASAA